MKPARIIRFIAQAWLLLLIAGSLQPARPAAVVALHREIHWLGFAGAALLLLYLSKSRRREVLAVVGMCTLGLSLEVAQHLVYRHLMEWRDVRDDTLAVLAAFVLYRLAGVCRTGFGATRPGGLRDR